MRNHREDSTTSSRLDSRRLLLAAILVLLVASVAVEAVKLDDVSITLQSHRYYKSWDLTRLVYRVKGSQSPWDSWWALELGSCVTDEVIYWWASSSYEWIEEPLRGIRFERWSKNQKFYLWLIGQWDVSPTGVVLQPDGGQDLAFGEIDGPACAGASISLETASGASVGFPPFTGVGEYAGDGDTVLRVTSTSAGWSLTHSTAFAMPEGASTSVLERILDVAYDPFTAAAGTTDVNVGYVLVVEEEDLAGLPEGTYVIQITYTASTD